MKRKAPSRRGSRADAAELNIAVPQSLILVAPFLEEALHSLRLGAVGAMPA